MPLRSCAAEVLQIEEIAEELSRALSDDDRVRLGDPLQTRREVRRLADNPRSCAAPDPIRSPTTTKPVAMPTRVCSGAAGLQSAHRLDQLQSRPYCSLGIILMRLRIAEVYEDTVAHVLRHEPAEALDSLGDAFLIGGNDLAQVLRVHAGGECRRADEVREHHRDLAALGGVLGVLTLSEWVARGLDGTRMLRNGR